MGYLRRWYQGRYLYVGVSLALTGTTFLKTLPKSNLAIATTVKRVLSRWILHVLRLRVVGIAIWWKVAIRLTITRLISKFICILIPLLCWRQVLSHLWIVCCWIVSLEMAGTVWCIFAPNASISRCSCETIMLPHSLIRHGGTSAINTRLSRWMHVLKDGLLIGASWI